MSVARRMEGRGPRRRRPDPQPLGELVPGVLRAMRPPNKGILEELRAAWTGIVGAEAAGRARLVSYRNGTLVVEVSSAAVKHHLSTFRATEILDALRRQVPRAAVRAVRYRVGS